MTTPTREPPKAFKGASEALLQGAIVGIAAKLFKLAKPGYYAHELLELFVPRQYHRTLSDAFALNEGQGQAQYLYVDLMPWSNDRYTVSGKLQFQWYHHTSRDGFFPIYRSGGRIESALTELREDCDEQVKEKFEETIRRMLDISFEWGLVMTIFNGLNQPGYCATPAQLRYVWPSVLQLALETGNKDLVATVRHSSSRAGDKARIPSNISMHVRDSYDIVTKSVFLIEHEATDQTAGGISYFLRQPMFTVRGLSFEGMT